MSDDSSLSERLAAAISVDRPWQISTGPLAAAYWRARATAMLRPLDARSAAVLVAAAEGRAALGPQRRDA